MKQLVAEAIAQRAQDGQTIGFGSGSTAELAIKAIGARVHREKLKLRAVPTSYRTAMLAQEFGIEVLPPLATATMDWAFDGADEVDPQLNMIKGRGAAMLNEKLTARRCANLVILITEDKLVNQLGEKFAVPVEVIPEAAGYVEQALSQLGATSVILRDGQSKYGPCISEHNNFILDARFPKVALSLEAEIKGLTGVIESGIFIGCTKEVLVARNNQVSALRLGSAGVTNEPL